MAKASVTMVCPDCGSEFTWAAIKSNRREADAWERWAAGQHRQCQECYRRSMIERRERERAEALNAASISAGELGFVALIGSDKQIAWAMQIRANVYNVVCPKSATEIYRNAVITEINAHSEARWWIDRRDGDAVIHVRRSAQEMAMRALPQADKDRLLADARKRMEELTGVLLSAGHRAEFSECEFIVRVLG